jgi:hypothetical protein
MISSSRRKYEMLKISRSPVVVCTNHHKNRYKNQYKKRDIPLKSYTYFITLPTASYELTAEYRYNFIERTSLHRVSNMKSN